MKTPPEKQHPEVSVKKPSGVSPFPIKSAGALGHWAVFELAIIEPDNRYDLAHIAGGEDFVGFAEILDLQRGFMHGDACGTQERNDALARDAVQECAVGNGVNTSPPRTMKTLDVAVSATLPTTSVTSALWKPLAFASCNMRALFG